MPTTFTVSSEADLQNAIDAIDIGGKSSAPNLDYQITFAPGFTTISPLSLGYTLHAINLASTDTLTIDGSGGVLDGGNRNRGFFVYAGNVTIRNLTIQDAAAIGGTGIGGGGGGAGLGGGVFVAAAGNVTLVDVDFKLDNAQGGAGGPGGSMSGPGGGIGLTGTGKSFVGYGGLGVDGGNGATGATYPRLTENRAYSYGDPGGPGEAGGYGGGGGAGGTGGGNVDGPGYGGEGGQGGFGGGGGNGGDGGDEAAGTTNLLGRSSEGGAGGQGGFGGGGGGSGGGGRADTVPNPIEVAGVGGFGAGDGGVGQIATSASAGAIGEGGGGLGAGGDVFIEQGGSLTIEGGTLGAGGAIGGTGANPGQAYGGGIFIQGGLLRTGALAGQTTTYDGVIADVVGSGGTSGAGGLYIVGAGTVKLDTPNTYTAGTTVESGILELNAQSATGSGGVGFLAGAHATLQLDAGALASGGTFSTKLSGLDATDAIDLRALAYAPGATANYDVVTRTLKVTSGGVTDTITRPGTTQNFIATPDGFGGTQIVMVCFAGGTRIATVGGEVAVEELRVGDIAITASGAHRAIRWLGHRAIECRSHPRAHEVMPIRVAAHAFGPDRPSRDLRVSPGHSICVDLLGEVLIPAGALVNGSTVVQEDVDHVTYWHVELEGGHDILLAENLPCESYLEMGNRGFFAEAEATALHAVPDAPIPTHADFCRPFHADGSLVAFVRERLDANSAVLGWRHEDVPLEGNLHLEVDGRRLEPELRGLSARFCVPATAKEVWLVSETAVPARLGPSADTRTLGVCLSAVTIADGFGASRVVRADDQRFCVGFHHVEEGQQRWTAGRARLPATLWDDCPGVFFLCVELARPSLPRWVAPRGGAVEFALAG